MSSTFPKKLVWTILCLMVSVAVLSCEKDRTFGEISYSFQGTISDSTTGLPIDSARVSLSGTSPDHPSWYTDSTGSYRGATFGGRITIYVQKTGHVTQSRQLNLNRNLTSVDFMLVSE